MKQKASPSSSPSPPPKQRQQQPQQQQPSPPSRRTITPIRTLLILLLSISLYALYPYLETYSAPFLSTLPSWSIRGLHLLFYRPFTYDSVPEESHDTGLIPNRVIAIGDVHGDFNQTLKVLQLANLINVTYTNSKANVKWTGGKSWYVQMGDIVDRGDDTILLYKLIQSLKHQASEAGGKVLPILGNHEVMNMMHDFRYVTEGDIASFGGMENRKAVWSKNGWLGKELRTWDTVVKVGDTVFVHAGVASKYAKMGIQTMNEVIRKALIELDVMDLWKFELFGVEGPVWYRGWAQDPEKSICSSVEKVLKQMGAKRMVMGHTPQLEGKILRRCGGRIYVVDIGISTYYGANLGVMEIKRQIGKGKDGKDKVLETVYGIYPEGRVKLSGK